MLFYFTNIFAALVILIFEGPLIVKNLGFWSYNAPMDNMLSFSVIGTNFIYYYYGAQF